MLVACNHFYTSNNANCSRLVQEASASRQSKKEEGENKENRLQLGKFVFRLLECLLYSLIDYKRTSLDDYVNTFTRFVDGLLADETRNELSSKAVHERIDN